MDEKHDLLTLCLAREILDGELVPLGLGTPLVTVAAAVAKALHAPGAWFLHPGNALSSTSPAPVALRGAEERALRGAAQHLSVDVMVWTTMGKARLRQFLRPAQLDPQGGLNTLAVARAGAAAARLPGPAIIPEAARGTFSRFSLYVPRHDRRTFVSRVDRRMASVAGVATPVRVLTDLCVLEYSDGALRAVSLHPGVLAADVRAASGCAIDIDETVPQTPPPTSDELDALDRVDPSRLRRLEFVPAGPSRRELIREMWAQPGDSHGDRW